MLCTRTYNSFRGCSGGLCRTVLWWEAELRNGMAGSKDLFLHAPWWSLKEMA